MENYFTCRYLIETTKTFTCSRKRSQLMNECDDNGQKAE